MEVWRTQGTHASLKFEKDGSLVKRASGAPKSIGAKIGARWGVKIGKTHPALRLRFLRGNKYHVFRCGANLHSHTLARSMYHDELSCPSPAREYTSPRDDPSPPRLRTLPSPDHRPPRPILRLIVVSLLPHPPSVVSSPRSSVDCCFDPRTRLMLPPMASSSMSAAAVVFRRYRPSRCPRTMRRCLPSTQTAVALVERQSPLSCRCRRLPSSYDAAVVVVRCRRRRTLPLS